MAKEIQTGIRLTLKDAFSQGMRKATKEGVAFGEKMKKVAGGVDKAFSGVVGKLTTLGVSIGVGASINKMIELEDRLVKIGTVAGKSSKEMQTFKKAIFDASMMSDIKMSPDSFYDAVDQIMEKVGDFDFGKANLLNMGKAMRGFNADGTTMGGLFYCL
ncbi:MAG: hypothetical protein ACRC4W_00615 [Treponemataceae bacterium]